MSTRADASATADPADRGRPSLHRLRGLVPPQPVVVVGAIAVAALVLTVNYVTQLNGWIVMTDELLYMKLGVSAGDQLSIPLEIRGQPYYLYSVLYPLLIAPVIAAFDMGPAFEAVHVTNAVLMASTAIPAYLLARAVALPRLAGYLVAALSVAVPWMAMSAIVWTEVAGYPAFAWALFGMQRSLAQPGPRNDLLALAGMALAFFARTQFVFLLIVFPLALVIHEAGWWVRERKSGSPAWRPALRRVVRDHRVLLAGYGLLALGALVLAAGTGIRTVLGTYSTTSHGDLLPEGVVQITWQHVAAFGTGIGVVPLIAAAGWAVVALFRPAGRERHSFAVLCVLIFPLLMVQASSFTIRFSGGFQDRYVFYLAPLVFVAMAACLLDGRRSWPGVLAAGAVFASIADALSFEPSSAPPIFTSAAAVFWKVLDGRSYDLGQLFSIDHLSPLTAIEIGSLAAAAALAAALWRVRNGYWLLLAVGLPVLAFGVAETRYVLAQAPLRTEPVFRVPFSERDWIDDLVGASTVVGLVPNSDRTFPTQAMTWDVNLFNKSVRRSYSFEGGATHTPFHADELELDRETGEITATDATATHMAFSTTDTRFRPQGRRLGASLEHELYEVDRPYRASWVSSLIDEVGRMTQERARLRFFPQAGGRARRVTVEMDLIASERIDLNRDIRPQLLRPYAIRFPEGARSGMLAPGERRTVRFALCVPSAAHRDVTMRIKGNGIETTAEGGRILIGTKLRELRTSSQRLDGPSCPSA